MPRILIRFATNKFIRLNARQALPVTQSATSGSLISLYFTSLDSGDFIIINCKTRIDQLVTICATKTRGQVGAHRRKLSTATPKWHSSTQAADLTLKIQPLGIIYTYFISSELAFTDINSFFTFLRRYSAPRSKCYSTLPPPLPPIQIHPLPTPAPAPIAPNAEPQRTQRTDRDRLVQPQSAPCKIVHQKRRRNRTTHAHTPTSLAVPPPPAASATRPPQRPISAPAASPPQRQQPARRSS